MDGRTDDPNPQDIPLRLDRKTEIHHITSVTFLRFALQLSTAAFNTSTTPPCRLAYGVDVIYVNVDCMYIHHQ